MKQIQKTAAITERLRAAVGEDADIGSLTVYEAIALNTLPLRKSHPLYKGTVADRSLLLEMADSVRAESLPLQIMHDTDPLPIGRIFDGQVVGDELRVLFFVNAGENDVISKLENGTVDQVSVSVLSKQLLNSKSGFDYFGPDSTIDNIWSGTDPDGNTLGENGVFGIMKGLEQWFEMSLVGKGGAQNARIVSASASSFAPAYQRLAASGVDPRGLVLTATTKIETDMTPKEFVEQLTLSANNLATANAKVTSLEATITEREASIANLTTEVETLRTQVAELPAAQEKAAKLDGALEALRGVATKILTAAGKVDVEVPTEIDAIKQLIEETSAALAAKLIAGGKAKDVTEGVQPQPVLASSAFQSSRRH